MINDDYHIACIFYHRYQCSIITRVRPGPSALRRVAITQWTNEARHATQRNAQLGLGP